MYRINRQRVEIIIYIIYERRLTSVKHIPQYNSYYTFNIELFQNNNIILYCIVMLSIIKRSVTTDIVYFYPSNKPLELSYFRFIGFKRKLSVTFIQM